MSNNKKNISNQDFIKIYQSLYVDRLIKSKRFKFNSDKYFKKLFKIIDEKYENILITKIVNLIKYEDLLSKNFHILNIDRDSLSIVILLNFNIYKFELKMSSYTWFERYKIVEPFAIQKNLHKSKTDNAIHCLFISIDYDKNENGDVNYDKSEIIIDDEEPLSVFLGNSKIFACKGLASEFKKEIFSMSTIQNYK